MGKDREEVARGQKKEHVTDDEGERTEDICIIFKTRPLAVQETSGFSQYHRNKYH